MLEALILWNLVAGRQEIREPEDETGWIVIPMLVGSALLWPIGLLMTARHYCKLSWKRSITATVVVLGLILMWVPELYIAIAGIVFVIAVWYFGNDEG